MASVWRSVLGVSEVGPSSNFFELGGSSLDVVRLARAAKDASGLSVSVQDVFAAPTLAALCSAVVQRSITGAAASVVVPLRVAPKHNARPVVYAVHPAGGSVYCFNTLAKHLSPAFQVYAVQFPASGGDFESLDAMASSYAKAVVKTHTAKHRGAKLVLAGYSFGATVASEMAAQLAADGLDVEHLVLLDSAPSVAGSDNWEDDEDLRRQGVLEFFEYFLGGAEEGAPAFAALPSDGRSMDAQVDAVAAGLPSDAHRAKMRAVVNAYVTCGRLMASHTPHAPYAVPALVVAAREDPDEELMVGLPALFPAGCRVVQAEGNHLSMLDDGDKAAALAGKLLEALLP